MVFIRIVAAEWAHTNVSGFPHICSKLHINSNLKKHINSEQVKICFNVRNVMNHLDPEVTLMMEMVLVAIKDVLSNVVVQDVDEFLGNLGSGSKAKGAGNGHINLRIMRGSCSRRKKSQEQVKVRSFKCQEQGKIKSRKIKNCQTEEQV